MQMERRRFLALAAMGATSTAFSGLATRAYAAWPERPVTMIVSAAPGGLLDTISRMLADSLTSQLGQNFQVDNKPGGGQTIAAAVAANAAPDGYTLLVCPQGILIQNRIIFKTLPYDPDAFELVCTWGSVPVVLVVGADVKANNLAELIALARSGEPVNIGTSGIGSSSHLIIEGLNKEFGLDLQHVAYQGETPALQAVLSGEANAAILTMASVGPQLSGGRIRPLAVGSPSRLPSLPDIPTLNEAGATSPVASIVVWQGMALPPGTPKDIVDRLAAAVEAALRDERVVRTIEATGTQVLFRGPEETRRAMEADLPIWTEMLTAVGVAGSQ